MNTPAAPNSPEGQRDPSTKTPPGRYEVSTNNVQKQQEKSKEDDDKDKLKKKSEKYNAPPVKVDDTVHQHQPNTPPARA